jgi:hypothetical protein
MEKNNNNTYMKFVPSYELVKKKKLHIPHKRIISRLSFFCVFLHHDIIIYSRHICAIDFCGFIHFSIERI